MGFQRGRRTYKIYFEDGHEFEGLEFRATGVTIAEASFLSNGATHAQLAAAFARNLLEWNFEDEQTGQPIDPTQESFKQMDADVVHTMATSWLVEVAGVRRPLGKPSSNGALTLPPGGIPPEAMAAAAANGNLSDSKTTSGPQPPEN